MATLEEKRVEKTEQILEASLKLFTENGFHATPISLIADTAGVGAGTIYRYFKNKEDLINELYEMSKKRMADFIFRGVDKKPATKEKFKTLWVNMFEFILNQPREFLFLEQFANTPLINSETREAVDKFFLPVKTLVMEAWENNEIVQIQGEFVWAFLSGPVISLSKMNRSGKIELTEKSISESFEVFWKGLEA
ncbi:MAG: TetR/AcrR family transcriptional regulator [Desulfobacterales bacterium]|nr:TetR/AcrR family transcriptional regulator [Desulfobacterales bacterium]